MAMADKRQVRCCQQFEEAPAFHIRLYTLLTPQDGRVRDCAITGATLGGVIVSGRLSDLTTQMRSRMA
jgi:hypothetical protein